MFSCQWCGECVESVVCGGWTSAINSVVVGIRHAGCGLFCILGGDVARLVGLQLYYPHSLRGKTSPFLERIPGQRGKAKGREAGWADHHPPPCYLLARLPGDREEKSLSFETAVRPPPSPSSIPPGRNSPPPLFAGSPRSKPFYTGTHPPATTKRGWVATRGRRYLLHHHSPLMLSLMERPPPPPPPQDSSHNQASGVRPSAPPPRTHQKTAQSQPTPWVESDAPASNSGELHRSPSPCLGLFRTFAKERAGWLGGWR